MTTITYHCFLPFPCAPSHPISLLSCSWTPAGRVVSCGIWIALLLKASAPPKFPQTLCLAQPAPPYRYLLIALANRTKMHIPLVVVMVVTSYTLLMRNKWPAVLSAEPRRTDPHRSLNSDS